MTDLRINHHWRGIDGNPQNFENKVSLEIEKDRPQEPLGKFILIAHQRKTISSSFIRKLIDYISHLKDNGC